MPLSRGLQALSWRQRALIAGAVAHGETALSELKIRPDYAVSVKNALVGFIEIKAPGKGADPRKFKDEHDRRQAEKLKSLPNLIYTDGNAFSLWRNGKIEGTIVNLEGDVETAGEKLKAPGSLQGLIASFLRWEPIPPTSPRALAEVSASLCRLLRDEVSEQLALANAGLAELAKGWRQLLFPDATNEEFADGYAQAVTFGLLMARARNIRVPLPCRLAAAKPHAPGGLAEVRHQLAHGFGVGAGLGGAQVQRGFDRRHVAYPPWLSTRWRDLAARQPQLDGSEQQLEPVAEQEREWSHRKRGGAPSVPANWLRHIEDIAHKHAAWLDAATNDEDRGTRLAELNVIEQVANVCRTTILRRAWYRGHRIEVHGLIYGLRDGLLRQLGLSTKDGHSWRKCYDASLQALERRHRVEVVP